MCGRSLVEVGIAAIVRPVTDRGREAVVAKRRYNAPKLTRLGLLRRLTRYTF